MGRLKKTKLPAEKSGTVRKSASAKNTKPELNALFKRLKQILVPYAKYMTVKENTGTAYTLVAPFKQNKAKRFGGVTIFSDHVTFFSCPDILAGASPAVRQKMQGSASVNLDTLDDAIVQDLEKLTAARFENFQAGSW